eukprot:TRINITY_DN4556_c0_g1_i1.p3 TRINITY_DN4556_c0_g1~~TRINITY_DN4556_c0_g1_i1.p3  ORF type:complete len:51 (+),score=10.45 TRINITY_DN4556_c0_g1_i1:510-662(+)
MEEYPMEEQSSDEIMDADGQPTAGEGNSTVTNRSVSDAEGQPTAGLMLEL